MYPEEEGRHAQFLQSCLSALQRHTHSKHHHPLLCVSDVPPSDLLESDLFQEFAVDAFKGDVALLGDLRVT